MNKIIKYAGGLLLYGYISYKAILSVSYVSALNQVHQAESKNPSIACTMAIKRSEIDSKLTELESDVKYADNMISFYFSFPWKDDDTPSGLKESKVRDLYKKMKDTAQKSIDSIYTANSWLNTKDAHTKRNDLERKLFTFP